MRWECVCHAVNIKKSFGPDDVSPMFLKEANTSLILAIHCIFNYSLHYGVIPVIWKRANVISLYKGSGDCAQPSSFRPISLLSILGKLLERLIKPMLEYHVSAHLSPMQSGFRHGRSTMDQLYRLDYIVRQAFHHRSFIDVVFLDFQKAFDSVWHDMILYKCALMNIPPKLWMWIHNFLHDRLIRCVWKGDSSDWMAVSAGVPQGAVLSPILYNIFINDIIDKTENIVAGIFADDVCMWLSKHGKAGEIAMRKNIVHVSKCKGQQVYS